MLHEEAGLSPYQIPFLEPATELIWPRKLFNKIAMLFLLGSDSNCRKIFHDFKKLRWDRKVICNQANQK